MRKLKTIFSLLSVLTFATAIFSSCEGHVEDDTIVPEGVLRIFVESVTVEGEEVSSPADAPQIKANGEDKVVFRVMYGSKNVSRSEDMNLVRTIAGDSKRLGAGECEFSATTPGTYVFTARYYETGAVYTDNEVTVTVLPDSEAETFDWDQKVLAMEFTSTSCTGCPALVTAMDALKKAYPDVLYTVAFHMDYMTADPMTIDHSQSFASEFIGNGIALPALFFNMHKPWGQAMTNILSVIQSELNTELGSYVPSCGVALSSVCDPLTREAEITVKVKSNLQQRCRLVVFLVEDGIVATQLDDPDYVHNNVVRDVLSTGIYGDNMNDRIPLYPGLEYSAVYKAKIDQSWNIDNMGVIAAVVVSDENGNLRADNTNLCYLKAGKSDYKLK